MPLESGQSLSHYRLVEKIGEGGMGVVWKAVDTNLDREVAIKLLPDGLAADPHRLERFQREAKLLASLSHARIASLYGLHRVSAAGATSSDIRFLSMELVEGEDLDQRLERGPLALDQALPVALQIAEGLEAAHESGVIHRDLKPANIKLTAQGDVKILDFGLAKALHDPISGGPQELSQSPTMTAAATQAGVILGTAAYMSPEQSRGQETDRRTDVWALGCVLYEMLTGRGAFHAATASDCIARILEREPDWEALPADTPPAVRRLLRRCLEKDPRRRWHDVADARIELEDLHAGVGSDPTPAASRSAPRVSIGLGVAAGLLVGVLLTAWWLSGRNAPAGPLGDGGRAPERFSIALPDESPAIPKPGTMAVAVSPDGRRIAYVGLEPGRSGARTISGVGAVETGTSGRTLLYLRDIDDYEIRPIEGTAGAASPFFSPDGEWIGFIDTLEARLKKIRVDGGVAVTVCDAPNRKAGHWGADGRIYFSGVSDGIFAVSENGGAPEVLSQPQPERGEKTRRFPHVLPGGRGVLFTLGTTKMESYDEAGVALLDPETGEHRMLLEGGMKPSYLPTGHILYGRGGALYAIPFDLETLEVSGAPFLVADEVVTSDGWGEAQYAVSDTGTLAYVPGGPEIYKFTVYWLDRDGRAEALPLPSRDYASALFSPDGKRLAISSLGANATIWVYENERRTMLRLTTEWDHYAVIWTRAGGHVTTASGRAGQYGFWNLAADGSGTEELLLDTKDGGYPGAWTLDDRALVFALANTGTGLDILTLNLDGKAGVTPLIQTSFQESNPKLSPDGRWLAYASDASGQTELYVQRYPEGGRRWQISAGGGEAPLWSPDGRELYYWKGGRMMAVSVDTDGSGFSPGEERALPQPEFSALLDWDISPDGERFVVVGRLATVVMADDTTVTNASPNRVEVRVPEIRVVTNWFEELRKER